MYVDKVQAMQRLVGSGITFRRFTEIIVYPDRATSKTIWSVRAHMDGTVLHLGNQAISLVNEIIQRVDDRSFSLRLKDGDRIVVLSAMLRKHASHC